jgi:hypothetical protein
MVARRALKALVTGVSAMIVVVTMSANSATATNPQLLKLKHMSTGLCLDASVSQGMRLNTCNNGDYQGSVVDSGQWVHLHTGLCLTGLRPSPTSGGVGRLRSRVKAGSWSPFM